MDCIDEESIESLDEESKILYSGRIKFPGLKNNYAEASVS